MVTGTFSIKGDGLTPATPYQPNFAGGPDGPLGYDPVRWGLVSKTATTMTVEFQPQ